jgi:hypothetical protein
LARTLLAALAVALCLPATGSASVIFGDKDVAAPSLAVNSKGIALVTYKTKAGALRHVLAWAAVNAIPHPTDPPSTQQKFQLDYSGGWKSQKNAKYWQTFKNGCKRYDGPGLVLLVTACKAPDGSYWALQSWQRNLPMRGFDPWTDEQKAVELHLSHWTGPLPVLEIYQHYTYGNANQGFFGRLMYEDQPVYGTRSPSAAVADTWARNIYIDVFNSDYGQGWKHDTAINTHPANGGFCYTFTPQAPPKGYPSDKPSGNGLGERYRILVIGPGVTPVVQWEGPRLGARSAAVQAAAAAKFDELLGGDKHCAAERSS